jgi:hypothetical protein
MRPLLTESSSGAQTAFAGCLYYDMHQQPICRPKDPPGRWRQNDNWVQLAPLQRPVAGAGAAEALQTLIF